MTSLSPAAPSHPGGARHALLFAATSALAVACGCLAVAAAVPGRGLAFWGRNAAAWIVGALLALLLARLPPESLLRALLLGTPLALFACFWSPGKDGVHRWVSLGSLSVNVAALCLPAAVVALAATPRHRPRWAWGAALLLSGELSLQPDASQATALAAAALAAVLAIRSQRRSPARALFVLPLLIVLAAAFCWTRPDPLPPVPEVEGIVGLACTVSTALATLCVVSLAAACASPLLVLRHPAAASDARAPAIALSVCLLAGALMPLCGAFPVPLVGMSISPILGFWIGAGALMAVAGRPAEC